MAELNITEFSLATTAIFTMNGQTRTAGDVHFAFDPTNTIYDGPRHRRGCVVRGDIVIDAHDRVCFSCVKFAWGTQLIQLRMR